MYIFLELMLYEDIPIILKDVQCVKKVMRSDNLKRHWKSKHRTSDIELTITVKHRSKTDSGSSSDNDLK